MSEYRRVESRLTLALEQHNLSIYEGTNPAIRASFDRLNRDDEQLASQLEIIEELKDSRRMGEAVYSLVRRQELAAIASFSMQRGPVADSDFRMIYTPVAIGLRLGDEVAFLESIHSDLRDGLRPPVRRYEGDVWTAAGATNLFEQEVYEHARYQEDQRVDGRVYYVRRT